jgi:hypothetical protein
MRPKTPGRKPRGPNKFRKSEATRLCRGVLAAGLSISRVECDPLTGRIVVFPGRPDGVSVGDNPWDEVLDNATDQKRPS